MLCEHKILLLIPKLAYYTFENICSHIHEPMHTDLLYSLVTNKATSAEVKTDKKMILRFYNYCLQ